MPVNKRSKFRGSRTCGGGTHKNRRGAGNRGGRGRAGACKHHFVKIYMEQGYVFGKDGFNCPTSKPVSTIDIGTIDQAVSILIADGIARQEGDAIVFDVSDIGVEKVLGSGRVTHKFTLSAPAFSEQAKEKIEAQGGQALVV